MEQIKWKKDPSLHELDSALKELQKRGIYPSAVQAYAMALDSIDMMHEDNEALKECEKPPQTLQETICEIRDAELEDGADGIIDFYSDVYNVSLLFLAATSEDELVRKMQLDILTCVQQNIIPSTVKSFSELHDYVDANCLGGLCDDVMAEIMIQCYGGRDEHEGMPQGMLDTINNAQNAIDEWIKKGGIKNA
jgi:hypothetical protein